MTEQQYRDLVVQFDKCAKAVTACVSDDFASDRIQIYYHVRYACALLRDIRAMIDMKENPNKVFAEYTPKPQSLQAVPSEP